MCLIWSDRSDICEYMSNLIWLFLGDVMYLRQRCSMSLVVYNYEHPRLSHSLALSLNLWMCTCVDTSLYICIYMGMTVYTHEYVFIYMPRKGRKTPVRHSVGMNNKVLAQDVLPPK